MTKKLSRWFLPSLLAILGILTLTTPVFAAIPQPTSLEIREVAAYENAREEGDQLYLVTYYIDFETLPDENADQLFIFRLREGEEVLSTAAAFPFHDQGYGLGLVAFYLSPDEAAAWDGDVSVQLIGNPLIEWDGNLPSTVFDNITWNTGTTAEVQGLIASKILYLATMFGQDWGVDLVGTVQGITSLTSAGASYFLVVVQNVGEIVPYVFGEYTFAPDYPEDSPADTDYATELETGISGTIFDLTPQARSLGMSRGSLTATVYYTAVVILLILLIYKKGLKKGMMLLAWPVVIAGAFFGVPLVVTILGGFFCLISTSWLIYKGVS